MKFNPCGRALDFGRRCYTVQVKPFKDSDLTVGWRWYPALPEAGTYDGWSFLTSRDWLENHDENLDLGEVEGDPREFYFGRPNPWATGEHVCGTPDEFENGQKYDPEQNTPYRRDGLPMCCVGFQNEGVVGGGYPGAVVTTRPVYRGEVIGGGYPALASYVPPLYLGNVRGGDYPRIAPFVPPEYLGDVRGGDYPDTTDVTVGGGVEDPGEDYCTLQGNLQLDRWYLQTVNTPKNYAWGWLLEPGSYCLAVRATASSATGDPEAWIGPNCGNRFETRLAGINGGGPGWQQNGTIFDPERDPYENYWYESFTIEEQRFVFLICTPDDEGGIYVVRMSRGACMLAPPLPQIRWYYQP